MTIPMNYIIPRGLPASGKSELVKILSNIPEFQPVMIIGTDDVRERVKFEKDVPKDPSDKHRADTAFMKKKGLVYDFMLRLGTHLAKDPKTIIEELLSYKGVQLNPREIMSMYDCAKEIRKGEAKVCIYDATFIKLDDLRSFYGATAPLRAVFDVVSPLNQIMTRAEPRKLNPHLSKSKAGPDVILGMVDPHPENSGRFVYLDSLQESEQVPHITIYNDSTLASLEQRTRFAVEESKSKGWLSL